MAHPRQDGKLMDTFYVQLVNAYKRGFTAIVSSEMNGVEIASENGLISGHSFELLGIYEVESDGEIVRLVKLRNPWGYEDWTGDWSKHSDLWTREVREQLDCDLDEDGEFYMSFEDFVTEYKRTSIVTK